MLTPGIETKGHLTTWFYYNMRWGKNQGRGSFFTRAVEQKGRLPTGRHWRLLNYIRLRSLLIESRAGRKNAQFAIYGCVSANHQENSWRLLTLRQVQSH